MPSTDKSTETEQRGWKNPKSRWLVYETRRQNRAGYEVFDLHSAATFTEAAKEKYGFEVIPANQGLSDEDRELVRRVATRLEERARDGHPNPDREQDIKDAEALLRRLAGSDEEKERNDG